MACQRTSVARLRSRRLHRRPRPRGCVLFGYFLLHKQEKVTRPPGWRAEKHTDVSRSSREAPGKKTRAVGRPTLWGIVRSRIKMDSGLRRNDEMRAGRHAPKKSGRHSPTAHSYPNKKIRM